MRLVLLACERSRRLRALFYGLPRSRARTFVVARYYHLLAERLQDGDFRFLPAVTDDAEVTLFDIATYWGRDGARQALTEWREMFASPGFALVKVINPPGPDVCLAVRFGGYGATSGAAVADMAYFSLHIVRGNTDRIQIFSGQGDGARDDWATRDDYWLDRLSAFVGAAQSTPN